MTSLTPEEQTQTTKDSKGNEITWAEKLQNDTIELIQLHKAYYNEALKKGLKLTKADEAYTLISRSRILRDEAKSAGSSFKLRQRKQGNIFTQRIPS